MTKTHIRQDYRDRLITLHKGIRGSVLKYETAFSLNSAYKDLVLRDNKGRELARISSVHVWGNICNHFLIGVSP